MKMQIIDVEELRRFGCACVLAGAIAALVALWLAVTTPDGAVRECLALGRRQCDVGWHDLWREFLVPLAGLTLVGTTVICYVRAALAARVVLGALSSIGVLVTMLALYAALQHNPQEEFCIYVKDEPGDWLAWMLGQEPCQIVWSAWIRLACAWLILALPPILLLHSLMVLTMRLLPPRPPKWLRRPD
jgi:hypothetical protein